MASGLLIRGQMRTRWRRYALVAGAFAFGLFAFFLVFTLVQGAQEAIVRPIGSTLTGDLRVTNGSKDIGSGRTWDDYRPLEAELERVPEARATPRIESNYITLQRENIGDANFDNWSAGLLLGIDVASPDEQGALGNYIVWGHALDATLVFDSDGGKAYSPLVLGRPAVRRLNLTLSPDGNPDFNQVLTLTSGRTVGESTVPFFQTIDCVLVGVFDTGLEPVDKFTAYVPIESTRTLLGRLEGDPVANAVLVFGASKGDVDAVVARHEGHRVVSAQEFAFGYMGSLLVVLYAAAAVGLALFSGVLLVWLVHQTGSLVRQDQAVVSSLRAIGIPSPMIRRGYAVLATGAVAFGAATATLLTALLAWLAPPLRWSVSGLHAEIPWRVHPWAVLAVAAAAILASLLSSAAVARRIQRLNILDGLRAV